MSGEGKMTKVNFIRCDFFKNKTMLNIDKCICLKHPIKEIACFSICRI